MKYECEQFNGYLARLAPVKVRHQIKKNPPIIGGSLISECLTNYCDIDYTLVRRVTLPTLDGQYQVR